MHFGGGEVDFIERPEPNLRHYNGPSLVTPENRLKDIHNPAASHLFFSYVKKHEPGN